MHEKLRTGRPRDNWLKETMKEYWDDILKEYTRNKHTNRTLHGIALNTPLNLDNREHYYLIKAAANDDFFIDPQAFEVFKKIPKPTYSAQDIEFAEKWFEENGRPTENVDEKIKEAIRTRQPILYKFWNGNKQKYDYYRYEPPPPPEEDPSKGTTIDIEQEERETANERNVLEQTLNIMRQKDIEQINKKMQPQEIINMVSKKKEEALQKKEEKLKQQKQLLEQQEQKRWDDIVDEFIEDYASQLDIINYPQSTKEKAQKQPTSPKDPESKSAQSITSPIPKDTPEINPNTGRALGWNYPWPQPEAASQVTEPEAPAPTTPPTIPPIIEENQLTSSSNTNMNFQTIYNNQRGSPPRPLQTQGTPPTDSQVVASRYIQQNPTTTNFFGTPPRQKQKPGLTENIHQPLTEINRNFSLGGYTLLANKNRTPRLPPSVQTAPITIPTGNTTHFWNKEIARHTQKLIATGTLNKKPDVFQRSSTPPRSQNYSQSSQPTHSTPTDTTNITQQNQTELIQSTLITTEETHELPKQRQTAKRRIFRWNSQ